jgi:hypothetical protein
MGIYDWVERADGGTKAKAAALVRNAFHAGGMHAANSLAELEGEPTAAIEGYIAFQFERYKELTPEATVEMIGEARDRFVCMVATHGALFFTLNFQEGHYDKWKEENEGIWKAWLTHNLNERQIAQSVEHLKLDGMEEEVDDGKDAD